MYSLGVGTELSLGSDESDLVRVIRELSNDGGWTGSIRTLTIPAKTVADCFKYRSQVGLDVAIEALRDCLRSRRATVDDIWHFAAIDRVQNVMRPYIEATV